MGRISRFGVLACLMGSSAAAAGDDIALVRPLDRWIDLSGGSRPVAILFPNQPAYHNAANTLAATIERRGAARPRLVSDTSACTPADYTVIALGNVNNNRLIARLYFNHYSDEDSLRPGPAGFTIRTVFDPYPWHRKGDVLILGVSTTDQLPAAVARLTAALGPGKTPLGIGHTIYVSTSKAPDESRVRAMERETAPSFYVFLNSAHEYLESGQPAYARHAIQTLDRIVESLEANSDRDCDWPEETHSDQILATWDAFEECPLIDDDRRLAYSRAMLQFMRSLVSHVSGYRQIGTGDLVTWNHTTFPLMGLYFGSRYFQDYCQLPEASRHLAKARACLLSQARSWKPQEDADSYLTITMRHTYEYCLAEWNLEFFTSGRMRKYADYVVGICDSQGLASGFGDSGLARYPYLIEAALPVAFWWYRDPGYLWILRNSAGSHWQNPFHLDVEPRRPTRHDGIRLFPLDVQLFDYTRRQAFYGEPPAPPNVPREAAFDKIALRESMQAGTQYLLLDGFSRGKHFHFDGNSIIEFVDLGTRWLLDHDYLTRNTTAHNMLSVIRGGRAKARMPSCAGVRCLSELGGKIGLLSTEVRDYGGVDWSRSLFWQKGDAVVVVDRATARQAGSYDLDLTWKVEDQEDETLLDPRTFLVRRRHVRGRSRHVPVIEDAMASGQKAVSLGRGDSVLAFVVELPAGREVVVAGGDTYVHLLDQSGRLLSRHQIRGPVWNQNFGDRPWRAYTASVQDLDGDGTPEIIVGTENYELHIYNAEWKLLGRARRAVLHGSIDFLTADTDGDGKREIFATDHYGHVQVFHHDARRAANFYSSIGDVQAALADLNGNGRAELIYGSSTGDLLCTELSPTTPFQRGSKTLWRFDNFGYGVNRVRVADLNADGVAEVIVASQTGYLYVLDSSGNVTWQDRAGTDIIEAIALKDAAARLAYLDAGGQVTLASGDGRQRRRTRLGVRPRVALQQQDRLVVGGAGDLAVYSLEDLWRRGAGESAVPDTDR